MCLMINTFNLIKEIAPFVTLTKYKKNHELPQLWCWETKSIISYLSQISAGRAISVRSMAAFVAAFRLPRRFKWPDRNLYEMSWSVGGSSSSRSLCLRRTRPLIVSDWIFFGQTRLIFNQKGSDSDQDSKKTQQIMFAFVVN